MNPSDLEKLRTAAAFVRKQFRGARPQAGLICGSGWGGVIKAFKIRGQLPYEQIPGLGKPGVQGHGGRLIWAEAAGIETFIFQGRRHYYEGEGWVPVAIPPFVLKALGAETVFLTNAAGGIRDDLKPGRLMLIRDHINFIGTNPMIGPHVEALGPRFADQSTVYGADLRAIVGRAAAAIGEPLAEGVYLAGSGPFYETPAEIRMYRVLGADAVGMSTVPEAQIATSIGLRVAAISCITNLAAGISPTPLNHKEVTEATDAAMPRMTKLVAACWKELAKAGKKR